MRTWSACTTVEGDPERVLAVLTDPEACARWSPVRFDVEDLEDDRLRTGSALRLAGRLAGRTVGFDVRILRADERRLALRASGPVDIEADYEVEPVDERTRLRASVSVQAGPRADRARAARRHRRAAGRWRARRTRWRASPARPRASRWRPDRRLSAAMIDPLERWARYGEKPDYAGLLTFSGVPYTQDPAELDGVDVAIVGAPTDDLVSDRPGARFGPRAIRAAGCPPGPAPGGGDRRLRGPAGDRLRRRAGAARRRRRHPPGDRGDRGRGARRRRAADRPGRRPRDRRARHPGLRRAPRAGRARPLRHPHRHGPRGLRRGDLPRDADVPAGRAGPRRSAPLRPDRPARLLAGRAGVLLAGRARDPQPLHARRARPRDPRRGGRGGGDRR